MNKNYLQSSETFVIIKRLIKRPPRTDRKHTKMGSKVTCFYNSSNSTISTASCLNLTKTALFIDKIRHTKRIKKKRSSKGCISKNFCADRRKIVGTKHRRRPNTGC